MSESNYKTDRFGRPDDRDYHYRIPLNNDAAMRKASLALNGMFPYSDRFVVRWDEHSGDSLSYMGIKTHDSKGHLDGLAKFSHSPKWQNLGRHTDINEYRQNPKGGTIIKGTFRVDPQSFNGHSRLSFKTTIAETPTELEQAYENMGDTWQNVQDAVRWAKDDAMENAREQITNRQQNCEHEHAVFPENHISDHGGDGYCEDCGAELTQNKELAY